MKTSKTLGALALASALMALSLAACDSGSQDSRPVVETLDVSPTAPTVPGDFDDGPGIQTLSFVINEDEPLYARFVANAAESEALLVTEAEAQEETSQSDTFFVTSLPEHGLLTLRSGGAIFNYTPEPDFHGEDQFRYAAPDDTEITVAITINSVQDAPVLSRDLSTIADQGRLYSATLEASDGDGDELAFSADNLPAWLSFDAQSGILFGVPRQDDIGTTQTMVLRVEDSTGLSDTISDFTLEVVDINDPPIINITQVPRELFGRESVRFNVLPDDLDGDAVSVSVEPDPAFTTSVEGGIVQLQMQDIRQARSIMLTIVGRDVRGAVTREQVPVELYPLSASGTGSTILGYKDGPGVHVVILGDGYTAQEQSTFRKHVEDVLNNIRSDEGIADHMGAFNFHMITSVSKDSGADDNDRENNVDTVFDSWYNCRDIPRLVCADVAKLYNVALADYPEVKQLILLVNDVRFGGSGSNGGSVAITSAYFPEIALHEMGHSLADLADEYTDPLIPDVSDQAPFSEGRYANVSLLNDPAQVPWAHWIDSGSLDATTTTANEVGVFEGGFYRDKGVFRGTFNSRMRNYSKSFGPINTEQWILHLYELTSGVRKVLPEPQLLVATPDQIKVFTVDPIFGNAVQAVSWSVNGAPIMDAMDEGVPLLAAVVPQISSAEALGLDISELQFYDVTSGDASQALASLDGTVLLLALPSGEHELELNVRDTSGKIRISPPHRGIYTQMWRISVQ